MRVWAPDQRGYNLSDKPEGVSAYHIDISAQDILGLSERTGWQIGALRGGQPLGAARRGGSSQPPPAGFPALILCKK
ncbi:MAG: hypothetical protein PVG14_00535 [Anaerolineales bacterium]|jgi:pimeloyl-ACP methyl ester carboxylesterase